VKIRLLWFGRRGAAAFDAQVEIYRQRVQRRWPADDRVLKPVTGGRSDDPHRVLRAEARALEKALEPGAALVVFDERGRSLTSEGFAEMLRDHESRSTTGIDLVIGSDLGLDRQFVDRAATSISLSRMTLPHQIARLLVWEQLFRATHILGGGKYHRTGIGAT
jgi:23S rRNA (pseudouridine1915-N3)-methyltransferase